MSDHAWDCVTTIGVAWALAWMFRAAFAAPPSSARRRPEEPTWKWKTTKTTVPEKKL